MTERKPAGMSFESWVDRQIREAKDRGEFDNLPGTGKPIPSIDGPADDDWWVKQWLKREDLSFTPPVLALRKSVEDMLESVGRLRSEQAVRNVVEDLNGRIRQINRMPPVDGPPSNLFVLDVDEVLDRWREQRPPEPEPVPIGSPSLNQEGESKSWTFLHFIHRLIRRKSP